MKPSAVVLGVELEAYTIQTPGYRIGHRAALPRKGAAEKKERFGYDESIGTEYNSQPFATVREGLFLLKAGLRKYNRNRFRTRARRSREILLVGGWRDRFAGAHIHVSRGRGLTRPEAKRLVWHLHDHLPLIVAMGVNSPVWENELTEVDSNRVLGASSFFFKPTERRLLSRRPHDEMLLSAGRVRKPATLEIRVLDTNVPEFILSAACVVKAIALRRFGGGRATNLITREAFLQARQDAAVRGMNSRLCWNGRWMPARQYLVRFLREYRKELDAMDVPDEVWGAFELLDARCTGATLIRRAVERAVRDDRRAWQRLFARRYVTALDRLLSGNDLEAFAHELGVNLPRRRTR